MRNPRKEKRMQPTQMFKVLVQLSYYKFTIASISGKANMKVLSYYRVLAPDILQLHQNNSCTKTPKCSCKIVLKCRIHCQAMYIELSDDLSFNTSSLPGQFPSFSHQVPVVVLVVVPPLPVPLSLPLPTSSM